MMAFQKNFEWGPVVRGRERERERLTNPELAPTVRLTTILFSVLETFCLVAEPSWKSSVNHCWIPSMTDPPTLKVWFFNLEVMYSGVSSPASSASLMDTSDLL